MGSDKNLEDASEVLVISAQRKGKGMLFPKGGWESDESIKEAALRESLEEAGVFGTVEVGSRSSFSQHKFDIFFVLHNHDNFPRKKNLSKKSQFQNKRKVKSGNFYYYSSSFTQCSLLTYLS